MPVARTARPVKWTYIHAPGHGRAHSKPSNGKKNRGAMYRSWTQPAAMNRTMPMAITAPNRTRNAASEPMSTGRHARSTNEAGPRNPLPASHRRASAARLRGSARIASVAIVDAERECHAQGADDVDLEHELERLALVVDLVDQRLLRRDR